MDHSGLSYGNFCEKNKYFAPLQSNLVILPIFFTKMAITQPRMIQIPKFWCLKSCTNIWLHFGNIYSIQKINRIELEGKKGSKFAKIGQFFTLQKIKIEFSQKFPKVWFHGFFLSLPTYETFDISLKKFLRTGQVWWERCTGGVTSIPIPFFLLSWVVGGWWVTPWILVSSLSP